MALFIPPRVSLFCPRLSRCLHRRLIAVLVCVQLYFAYTVSLLSLRLFRYRLHRCLLFPVLRTIVYAILRCRLRCHLSYALSSLSTELTVVPLVFIVVA
jgi:hypothetical protein